MQVIHVDSINPNLKQFLFESRNIILKNPSNGFNYRCYTKYLNGLYQYLTLIPNCIYNAIPIDILTKYDGTKISSNLLIGSFITELPIDEYNKLYSEIEKLIELDSSLSFSKEKLKWYYNLKIFSDDTISKIMSLRSEFDISLNDSFSSNFDYMYYLYYLYVENARKQNLECSFFNDDKIYTKLF